MHANVASLNALRAARGMNTFSFRPHCGEAGNITHLVSGFICAESICHGIQLAKSPALQYLYYLAQVGLAVSPLCNDILFLPLRQNPFGEFFRRGLNVSLSTDDPLIVHLTDHALVEEYAIAAREWSFSSTDLCEIARNSVLQSGFEDSLKRFWIGENYMQPGLKGLDVARTNVPEARTAFREECLTEELKFLGISLKEAGRA